jgi:uncharacterized protein YneR
MLVVQPKDEQPALTWHSDCLQISMSSQQDFFITYSGRQVKVTPYSDGVNTFFTVHFPANELQLKVQYIEDNPYWVENDGIVTERSEQLGRLIEESDGR